MHHVVVGDVEAEVEVEGQALGELEGVQQTEAVAVGNLVGGHVTADTEAEIGDGVPQTVLLIAEEEVVEVEEHLLLQIPVLVAVVVGVLQAAEGVGLDLTAPEAAQAGTETDARSEPLTDGHGQADGGTGAVEEAGLVVKALLLVGVEHVIADIGGHEPVAPERVGQDAVLVAGCRTTGFGAG